MADVPHQLAWRIDGRRYWLRDVDSGEDITDLRELELKLVEIGSRRDILDKAKSMGCDYYLISLLPNVTPRSEIINYFVKKD